MKILIVDDHLVVRQGVKQILADEFPEAAFGEASSVGEAMRIVPQETWSIVLLDLTLPDRNGLEAIADLKALRPRLPVLILSMHPETEFAVRAIKAGASGYLTKQSAAEEMIAAVRKALTGGRYITASLAEKLAADVVGDSSTQPHEQLSDREYQTLLLLAEGKSVKAISAQLGLSNKTVSTYRARVLEKLHLTTTVELARYAIAHRLVR
jgi:DNA-binding NarL/FixJ family response regulator